MPGREEMQPAISLGDANMSMAVQNPARFPRRCGQQFRKSKHSWRGAHTAWWDGRSSCSFLAPAPEITVRGDVWSQGATCKIPHKSVPQKPSGLINLSWAPRGHKFCGGSHGCFTMLNVFLLRCGFPARRGISAPTWCWAGCVQKHQGESATLPWLTSVTGNVDATSLWFDFKLKAKKWSR